MHRLYEVSASLTMLILCLFVSKSYANGPASVHFNLNECTSNTFHMTNADYSEFTAEIENSAQIQMSVIGNNLYRNNPASNPHSCTPGVNGTEGMCVSYDLDCNFSPGSAKSVRIDILVEPLTDEEVTLSQLNFYEKSPLQFDWIDGISGPNNYPLFYGIRVLKGQSIIYEQSGIPTDIEWNLENFNFSGIDGFTVSESTVFNFELTAYCPIGNGYSQHVWDLDEITLIAECESSSCFAEGGTLEGGPFEFCVGDGIADNLAPGSISLSGNTGTNSQWVITDENGNILGIPPMPSVVDFDGAGPGTCLIWHLSFENGLTGAVVGNNASDIQGCHSLSNPIAVVRNQPEGGTLTGGPFEFCVGDGVADNLAAGAITLSGNGGSNSQWVVTDENGNILGLPPTPTAVDFDGAGPGTCLIWHLSFEDGLTGATVGSNAADLQGCYSLSNPVSVVRTQLSGGTLSGGPFEFCVGDGVDDNIAPGQIVLAGNSGPNNQWVVTDDQGNILGLPPMPSAVNFDGAGSGTCLIWHLSFENGLSGATVGNNAMSDLVGCYSLSNPITVVRNESNGGTLTGGPFEFCVGDGVDDNIAAGSITLSGNSGQNSQWVVTDENGNILGLPPMPSAVNFDGAGPGTCLIWHLSFADGLVGATVGSNANDLQGCYSLSNPISVVRNQPAGGTLTGGPFSFCVGDGVADNIAPNQITLSGNSGSNSQWVVTDDNGNILGLPPTFSAVDFDGAGTGTCLVWHLSFEDGLTGATVGSNAADLAGCYDLSNPITVVRSEANGGTLTGGPFEFCVGDGEDDNIALGSITLSGNTGQNSQWVVTDEQGNILGLPPMPSAVNFDGAGPGTCLIWHLSFADGLVGATVGSNANDLQGCYSLSNPISVVRNQPEGGTLSGGPFNFIVGDGVADNIAPGQIVLAGNSGSNSQWVVTDDQGMILGLPPTFSAVDFDGAGPGTCLVWHLSFADGLTGAAMGNNAMTDLNGCYSLSNPISVVRTEMAPVSGGTLTGGPFEFCVGDGEADNLAPGSITLTGNTGMNSQWVVTDAQGIIQGLPPMPSAVDFDGAGPGTCLIWHLSYQDGLTGALVGNNAMTDLVGNFSLSNSIAVVRNQPEGGTLTGGPFSFTVGDGVADNLAPGSITLTGNSGSNSQWVVTDDQGMILGLPPMPSAVDFEGAGAGICLIWHLSFEDGLTGAVMGNNAMTDLVGCYSLSNSVQVIREDASGCQANGGEIIGGPFTFTEIGDGTPDMIPAGSITLANNSGMNSQWVVTDDQGIILGLPPMPGAVDFDGAGAGTCLIWHLSYDGTITGAEVGMNANDIQGCWSLSNSIEVIRENASGCQANGGMLFGGPFTFTEIGDGVMDTIAVDSITLANSSGMNSQWVVTDSQGIILGLPPTPSAVNFDGAGAGTCLIWHLSFEDGLMGAEVGNNAMTDLVGCYSLSNSIEVVRENAGDCQANGGMLFGGPFSFTEVGDGVPDMIPAGSITLANASGMNTQWVVTDDQGMILGLPPMPGAVDFDGAGVGTCLIWHLSFDDGLMGAEVGNNAFTDLVGCYSLSNSITVERTSTTVASDSIVINEIYGGNLVEIKNVGTTTIDISSWFLCDFPNYTQMQNLVISCGTDLVLSPDEIVTVEYSILSTADGELGLYKSNAYSDPNAIIDYVEWGSTGHQRSSVAVQAGIWTTGDFVAAWDSSMSLEYDGEGNASTDWSEDAHTPCIENDMFVPNPSPDELFSFKIYPNPSSDVIELESVYEFDLKTSIMIYNGLGAIIYEGNLEAFQSESIDISQMEEGTYYIMMMNKYGRTTKSFIKIK